VAAIAAMVLIVALALLGVRYAVLTPQARLLIEARASGLKLGQLGTLKLQGLGGDVWRDFTVRRLTISDDKGVWLEADDLGLRWSYGKLLQRRLDVDAATARSVRVLRRPRLGPKGPPSAGLPVTVEIRDLRARVETLPAFSTRRGLFDVSVRLSLQRHDRGQAGAVQVRSLLHAGDFLDVAFDTGRTRPLKAEVQAVEAKGGALAGALGLPADQPFRIDARADGSNSGGRIDIETLTGSKRPLWAHGSWSSEGGVVAGKATLAASSLTAPYVQMFGPEAVFAAAGRRARVGGYGVAVRLRAANLSLAAQGPADPAAFSSPKGLQLAVIVPELSRIVGPSPRMGEGRFQGLVSGDPSSWRLTGVASVQRLEQDGYRLASASGPLTLTGAGKQLTLQARLQGAGGWGAQPLAGLAGASPKAFIDLVRLADGRLLIRQADAQGAGLRLTATGSRSLFGALSFKGQLEATNLALARQGAAGSARLSWSASQASASRPWLLSVDGQGHGFASGLPELDRLLGPEPRLRAQASWAGQSLAVASASVDGAKANVSANGRLDTRGPLALDTVWRAEGPFRAGPVRISGKASGKGTITGTLSAPRADLTADFAAIEAPSLPLTSTHVRLTFVNGPNGLDGQIAVAGDSAYGPARAKAGFRFVSDGVDLSGIDADAGGVRASGALALRGAEPSTADLQLAIGPGAVLSAGAVSGSLKIVDGAEPSASISLDARGAVLKAADVEIRGAHIAGSGPLSRLPLQITANATTPQGALQLNGSGLYQRMGQVQQLSITGGGAFRNVTFRTQEPILLRLTDKERTAHMRALLGGGSWSLDLRQGGGAVTAATVLRGVDLKALNQDFAGSFDADIALQGKGSSLGGTMTARLQDARSIDAPSGVSINAEVKARLQGDQLAINANATGAKGMTSTVQAELPVEASASPLRLAIVKTRPMHGQLKADGEVQPLWDLFYGGDRQLAGEVHLSGVLGGTLNDPQITGQASVANGRLQDYGTGLVLNGLSLTADLQRDTISLSDFSAKDDKGGQVTGSGVISLARGGGSSLKLGLQRFRLIDNDDAEATATGQVTLTRAADGKVKLVGTLSLDRAQINAEARLKPSVVSLEVVEKNRPERLAAQIRPEAAKAPPVDLDITLRAPRRVFVKGRGVDVELSLDAHVTGSLSRPQLSGVARVFQGSYDFAGKRFQFDQTGTIYLASSVEQIRLDLSATEQGPSLTATVHIRGTAAKPEITLTSTPSLPQDEILSQVLFGASASQLSGGQAAQLASTATALASGGGFDVLGSLRTFAKLDRLAIGGSQTSGFTVAGGKYLGDNVYVEVVGGGRQGPSVNAEWRIKRSLSLVSQIGQELGAKVSIQWTHDIGGSRRTAR
jgi:translocation and assembly module TamB